MSQLKLLWISFGVITIGFLGVSSKSINRFGDVIIQNDGKTFQCDLIICPKKAVRCAVSKYPDEADSNFTVRKDVCYGPKNDELLVDLSRDPAVPGQTQRLHVEVFDDGVSSSSSYSSGWGQDNNGSDDNQKENQKLKEALEESLGGFWPSFK